MRRLPSKAQELLDLLTETATTVVDERGWSPHTTLVSLFIPQKAMALALDVDCSTIRRWFYRYPLLRERVATAKHHTSISAGEGQRTVIDGMVWMVRLGDGLPVRGVPIEYLKHQYRNLDFDIQQGATLERALADRREARTLARAAGLHASSKTGFSGRTEKIDYLLGWVFGAREPKPVGRDACSSLEEAVHAVEDGADPSVLARVVGRLLRDRHSFRYWVRQVRQFVASGRLRAFADAVRRVLVDVREGFARSPAALLVSRLKLGGGSAVPRVEAVRDDVGALDDELVFEDLLPPVDALSVPLRPPRPELAAALAALDAHLAAAARRASAFA